MTLLAAILASVLIGLALLHLGWAIGFWWPIRDEAALARAVLGTPDARAMPGAIPCALVAVALMVCAILLFDTGFPLRDLLIPLIAAVFVLRGGAAYLPVWRKRLPTQPFATYDTRYYGPLCLGIGAGFFLLTIGGF